MSDSTYRCMRIVQMNLAAMVAISLGNLIEKMSCGYVNIMKKMKIIMAHWMPATNQAEWYAL